MPYLAIPVYKELPRQGGSRCCSRLLLRRDQLPQKGPLNRRKGGSSGDKAAAAHIEGDNLLAMLHLAMGAVAGGPPRFMGLVMVLTGVMLQGLRAWALHSGKQRF